LNIDDVLLAKAQRLTGLSAKAELVREGLQALIEPESVRRLGESSFALISGKLAGTQQPTFQESP
jgi:Arc/MetJ family transcription regulator